MDSKQKEVENSTAKNESDKIKVKNLSKESEQEVQQERLGGISCCLAKQIRAFKRLKRGKVERSNSSKVMSGIQRKGWKNVNVGVTLEMRFYLKGCLTNDVWIANKVFTSALLIIHAERLFIDRVNWVKLMEKFKDIQYRAVDW